jgi:membrane-bound metal-dependent hydrolase YbcI (DUF457 family)
MYVLSRWDIGHCVVGEWNSDSTLLLSSLSLYVYPQVRFLEGPPRELALHFTACLITHCSSDVNTTAKCWCVLPKGTYIILMFG